MRPRSRPLRSRGALAILAVVAGGWLLFLALVAVRSVPAVLALVQSPPPMRVVDGDPSGGLVEAEAADGLRAYRDVSGVRFALPAEVELSAVQRPDPTPETAVKVVFAWGPDCHDRHCVRPGGFLQFGTFDGATGKWYRTQVDRFGSHESYVRYAYFAPVQRNSSLFDDISLQRLAISAAPAWTIAYTEPRRDFPRYSRSFWQVTGRSYLVLSFVSPLDSREQLDAAIERVVTSVQVP